MGEERRRFARIEASLECTLATADQTLEAKVVNVSRNGLAVMAPEGSSAEGETISVMLERAEGGVSLAVSGTVVRVEGSGVETIYGIDFSDLPPDSEAELLRLLRLLAEGAGSGRREAPRISTRIPIRCKDAEAFGALLDNLSRGGMSIRCAHKVSPRDILRVEFGLEDGVEMIAIEGEVTRVEKLPDGNHLAGLKFTPPSDEQRAQVHQLLDLLMGIGVEVSRD